MAKNTQPFVKPGRICVAVVSAVAGITMLLSGCESIREATGAAKTPPDEFEVTPRTTLAIPPDFTLPPPQRGVPVRTAPAPAVSGPMTALASASPAGVTYSDAETLLLTRANALSANVSAMSPPDPAPAPQGPELAQKLLFEESDPAKAAAEAAAAAAKAKAEAEAKAKAEEEAAMAKAEADAAAAAKAKAEADAAAAAAKARMEADAKAKADAASTAPPATATPKTNGPMVASVTPPPARPTSAPESRATATTSAPAPARPTPAAPGTKGPAVASVTIPEGLDPNGYYNPYDPNGYIDRSGQYHLIQRGNTPARPGPSANSVASASAPPGSGGAFYVQGRYESDCDRGAPVAGTIFPARGGGLFSDAAPRGENGAVVGGVVLGGTLASLGIACQDQPYAFGSYAAGLNGTIGRRLVWRHGDAFGDFTASREFQRGDMVCRDFRETTYTGGRSVAQNGTACRSDDGHWRFD